MRAFAAGILVAGLCGWIAWGLEHGKLVAADAKVREGAALLSEGLVIVDSMAARIRCLEAAGVDCSEPTTIGGEKLPYGRRP